MHLQVVEFNFLLFYFPTIFLLSKCVPNSTKKCILFLFCFLPYFMSCHSVTYKCLCLFFMRALQSFLLIRNFSSYFRLLIFICFFVSTEITVIACNCLALLGNAFVAQSSCFLTSLEKLLLAALLLVVSCFVLCRSCVSEEFLVFFDICSCSHLSQFLSQHKVSDT